MGIIEIDRNRANSLSGWFLAGLIYNPPTPRPFHPHMSSSEFFLYRPSTHPALAHQPTQSSLPHPKPHLQVPAYMGGSDRKLGRRLKRNARWLGLGSRGGFKVFRFTDEGEGISANFQEQKSGLQISLIRRFGRPTKGVSTALRPLCPLAPSVGGTPHAGARKSLREAASFLASVDTTHPPPPQRLHPNPSRVFGRRILPCANSAPTPAPTPRQKKTLSEEDW